MFATCLWVSGGRPTGSPSRYIVCADTLATVPSGDTALTWIKPAERWATKC